MKASARVPAGPAAAVGDPLPWAAPRGALLKRVPPGVWLACLWGVATAYPLVLRTRSGPMFSGDVGLPALLVVAAAMVGCAALVRHQPLAALMLLLAATAVSTMAISVMDIPLVQFLPVDVAVCYIAANNPRRTAVTGAALSLAALVSYSAARSLLLVPTQRATAVMVALATVVAWLIGDSIRQSHLHGEALRAQAAAQAVTAERLRIARELHDMIAHSIGVIAIQAGMGSRVIDTQPGEARAALSTIEATSRETLAGLRRTLGALRRSAPPEPMPGLADLDGLAASTRAAGVRVDLRREGDQRSLPPDVDLAAFRIVQEALTNVVRHAGTAECRVTVAYGAEDVALAVEDDGTGTPAAAPGPGYGIAGMRERVALARGTFAAGPRAEGGFRVTARLPLPLPAGGTR